MHIERLTELAEWLEAGAPHKNGVVAFDMNVGVAHNGCGTVCCIAGAAVQFFSPLASDYASDAEDSYDQAVLENDYNNGEATLASQCDFLRVGRDAQALLGLDLETAEALFKPESEHWGEAIWDEITPMKAARVVRHLIATGRVDWDIVQPAE
jgi:hypothetical protein